MRTSAALLAFAVGLAAPAQTFTSWHTSDGLPSDDIRDVAVDPDGTIWLATGAGVASFNGTAFTVYTAASNPGLANDDVYAIAVMSNGDVWAGTDFGASRLSAGAWTTFTTADGLGDNEVKNIKQAPNGDIWLATINGATRRTSAGVFTAFGSPSIPFGGATHVAFASNGDVLLSGGLGGVIVYNGSTFTAITTANGLLSNRIRSIAVDGGQQKWVGTAEGISVLNASNVHAADHEHIFILPPPDELNPITDMLVDAHGRIWAGVYVDYLVTEGGISVYANGAWSQYEESDGLAGPNVRRLAEDGAGSIWVATSTGLTRISSITIGIEERGEASFRLFPSPANAFVEVMLDAPVANALVEVRDASGRLVMQERGSGQRLRLDVSPLRAGLYVMRIGDRAVRFTVER
jgi:ligand-binding sensor domain-containing protein